MTLVPGTPIGKYLVRRKLAEGGMAELYLCASRGPEGFEKEVVIKRIRPFLSSDPEFVKMFVAEARLASRLNHPNLVQIFDFDKHQDAYYLAMEHVRGHSLFEMRRRCKARMVAIPPILVAHIGAEVAKGLHHAHRLTDNGSPLGLVHRDVTPHNVLLSFDGAVKLTDFGIAKASGRLTSPGRLKGKLAYMSPEQSRGELVDARTDIFALGIVLWEMMTGGRLFEGDSDMAVLHAVRGSAIPSVGRLNPDVPLDLDGAVMKALARRPELRHQTAQEFERALAHCVLRNARTLEDTDVAGFIRMLFADECSSSSAARRAPPPLVPRRDLDTDRNRRSKTLAAEPSDKVRPQVEKHPIPLKPDGVQRRARSRRVALKMCLGAAALVALAATPRLHPVPPSPSSVSLATVIGESKGGALDSAAERSLSAEGREGGFSPTFSRAGGASLKPSAKELQTGHGILVLKIAPWAFLSVDGQSKGEVSGVRRYRLPAGKHRLRLWHPRGSKEVEVVLREGERLAEEYQVFSRPH